MLTEIPEWLAQLALRALQELGEEEVRRRLDTDEDQIREAFDDAQQHILQARRALEGAVRRAFEDDEDDEDDS